MISKKFLEKSKLILSFFFLFVIIHNVIAIFSAIHTMPFAFTDDPQHVHIAWNIFRGKVIYKDFFEHHGPLYGFFNAFIMTFLKEPASFNTLILFRTISAGTVVATGVLVYFLSRNVLKSNFSSLLSLTMFFSWAMTFRVSIQIRPDLLQCFFLILGLLILFYSNESKINKGDGHELKKNNKIYLLTSGICFGLAFLFNTKTILFFFPIFPFYLAYFLKKGTRDDLEKVIYLSCGIALPVMIILFYFASKSALHEYLYYTTIFNFKLARVFPEINSVNYKLWSDFFFKKDWFFSVFSILGAILASCQNKSKRLMLVIFLFTLVGLKQALPPYFSFIFLPLVSVFFANFFEGLLSKKTLANIFKLFMLLIISYFFFIRMYPINFKHPWKRFIYVKQDINWVLKHTKRSDVIATNWNSCAAHIFNEDLQYHWVRQDNFRSILGDDFWEKDFIKNLQEKNVKIISSQLKKLDRNTNADLYVKKKYKQLNLRKKENCIWVRR